MECWMKPKGQGIWSFSVQDIQRSTIEEEDGCEPVTSYAN